ncbi:hypothetical protein AMTR_s00014p00194310 [Amborella trichopoda]|uniref:Uncharacterized protein n=1 Tax=Amborella trichopoda TaxID=13333 RepID=W1PN53_AMBTC|nr:hypothetical protein AMTR_s00014p00194310 [Amborella trichopoda]
MRVEACRCAHDRSTREACMRRLAKGVGVEVEVVHSAMESAHGSDACMTGSIRVCTVVKHTRLYSRSSALDKETLSAAHVERASSR